jgi:prepilin-type N-terminal cleavage/methylation domain-containing protein
MASISPLRASTHGFTLVEMSIVLVILGLIAGGIISGQSLIRSSQLRSVSTDIARYSAAAENFRTKFGATPGDFKSAESYWGSATTCPGTFATPSTDEATCNGNGNEVLEATAARSNELVRFWQHLADAKMIEGQYTGVSLSGVYSTLGTLPGTNVPASKLGKAGYSVYPIGYFATESDPNYYAGDYGNALYLGTNNSTTAVANYYALKPVELWNIDAKMDDGLPGYGVIRSLKTYSNCVTSTVTPVGTKYLIATNSVSCALIYLKFV